MKWLYPTATANRRRVGTPTEIDWEAMFIELIARVNLDPDGIDPNTVKISDLAFDMLEWFESTGRHAPDESTIRKKLGLVMDRLRQN